MISDESIEELRKIYKKVYKEEISLEEAREMGTRLVTLYRLLAKPLPHEKPSSPDAPPEAS